MDDLGTLVGVWVAIAFLLYVLSCRRNSVGLVVAYLANLSMIGLAGAVINLFPWYTSSSSELVLLGMQQGTIGLVSFAVAVAIGWALIWRNSGREDVSSPAGRAAVPPALQCVVAGVVAFGILEPLLGRVPSVSAVVSQSWQLCAAGLALACWYGIRAGRTRYLVLGLVGVALIPLLTLATQGFLGFGATSALIVLSLVAVTYRPRWRVALATALVLFVGMSIFVTYFRDRNDLRAVIWGGQDASSRLDSIATTFTSFEWFDPHDATQLQSIDGRLDQHILDGAAVAYLQSGLTDYAHGQTLLDAAAAIVPRALWPDKPVSAGSGNLVSRYTGLRFDSGTSIGIGNVMEFYVNFGTWGVIIGFAILGLLFAWLDTKATLAVSRGNWTGFLRWFLPGVAMILPGGSLVELTASVAGAMIVSMVAIALWSRYNERFNNTDKMKDSEKVAPSEPVLSVRPVSPYLVVPRRLAEAGGKSALR